MEKGGLLKTEIFGETDSLGSKNKDKPYERDTSLIWSPHGINIPRSLDIIVRIR